MANLIPEDSVSAQQLAQRAGKSVQELKSAIRRGMLPMPDRSGPTVDIAVAKFSPEYAAKAILVLSGEKTITYPTSQTPVDDWPDVKLSPRPTPAK